MLPPFQARELSSGLMYPGNLRAAKPSMRQLKGLTPVCLLQRWSSCGATNSDTHTRTYTLPTVYGSTHRETLDMTAGSYNHPLLPSPANTLTSNQWTWIEGCHILAATLFPAAWVKMNPDSVYRLHIKRRHWEKTDYLLVESVIDILRNSFLSQGDLLIQFMVYKYLSNMCLK